MSTVVKPTTTSSQEVAPVFPPGRTTLFVLVTVLFFLWGMSNNLTDILVQQFKKSFELSLFGAQLVQTANFLGYFCMAIPAALVMRRWGMAQFGSAAASERRLNFAQAFNPPGTILGVVIGARFIFSE